jgi:mRNA-degrading endonuclease YafQ of YafQ-DinJ toxin-antitoxin module
MRTIKYTKQFKKDYKRLHKSKRYRTILDNEFLRLVKRLALDKPLSIRHADHV